MILFFPFAFTLFLFLKIELGRSKCLLTCLLLLQQFESSHGMLPSWLQVLLTDKFFNACIIHEDSRKNEKNIYCLDCCLSICPHCLQPHTSHRLLQIRRYVYHDVLRLADAHKLFDCSFVQSYTTNSAKVVFLKPRPQTRQFKGSGNYCAFCDRSLQDPYLYCSLSCKIDHILRTQGLGGVTNFLYDCKFLTLPEPCSDDGPMSVAVEPTGSTRTSSVDLLASTAATAEDVVRKKRSSLSSACRQMFPRMSEMSANMMMNNRRKKAPSRAPLY
ncbi:Protein RGF1 INDUCIBLE TRANSCRIPTION FACTOR 1 [Linum perenne]